jgi:TolB-like protein/Tfp pilus assembly protein PilF
MSRLIQGWLLALLTLAAPAPLFSQCPDGSAPPCRPTHNASPTPNSVAVLFFDNLSSDSADAYLADALTEEITSRLGDLPRIQIKRPSRAATRRLRDSVPDYTVALGRILRVRYLVEGSVRRAGGRVRVSARLLGSADGFRVWSSDYDRSASDLLELQEEIAREVATGVAGRLTPREQLALSTRPTRSPEAYEHLLRGNQLLASRTASSAALAIEEYRAALRSDPGFTRALGRIAYAYGLSASWGWKFPDAPAESLLSRGLAAATEALARDSTDSDAWLALGAIRVVQYPRTYAGAIPAFDRAIALDPTNAEALHQYGSILRTLGRDSAAQDVVQRALAIEPQRAISLYILSDIAWMERRFAESLRWIDSALAIDPALTIGYESRAWARFMVGDTAGARRDAITALRFDSDDDVCEALLVHLAVAGHDTASARTRIARLRTAPQPREDGGFGLAVASLAVADTAAALEWLEGQPRGPALLLTLREFVLLQPSPRVEQLIRESQPP